MYSPSPFPLALVLLGCACGGNLGAPEAGVVDDDVALRCPSGELGLRVFGRALDPAWEGKRVTVITTEKLRHELHDLRMSGVVHRGAIDLACERGLRKTLDYPSVLAYVDLDGDGACGPGDPVFEAGFYGWVRDVTIRLGVEDWIPPELAAPMAPSPDARACPLFGVRHKVHNLRA